MARRRTTFGKLQRDRDKQAKAKAKLERRAARSETSEDPPEGTVEPVVDQAAALAALAALQQSYGAGEISYEEFESRRDELSRSLTID